MINEQTSSISQALGFFSTALLVFAFIALFVGGFTILNTFSIIVGQRTRELALLRIVGASRRQVFRSVLAEAGIVGLVSSLIGLGLGVLAALGLEALLSGFGITLPSGPLVFEARTVIVGLVVGVGVTVVSAISPARRPCASPRSPRWPRQAVETLVPAPLHLGPSHRPGRRGGACHRAVGPAIALVGLGAVLIFVGVARLAPAVARPMASVIGRPLARFGVRAGSGGRTPCAARGAPPRRRRPSWWAWPWSRPSRSSARRSLSRPRAASTTPSAPTSSSPRPAGWATQLAVPAGPRPSRRHRVVHRLPGPFELQSSLETLTAVSTHHLSDTVILDMTAGARRAGRRRTADRHHDGQLQHLAVGDVVPVKFAMTGKSTMRIGGMFKANSLIGNYLVGDGFFLSHFQNPSPARRPVEDERKRSRGAGGQQRSAAIRT